MSKPKDHLFRVQDVARSVLLKQTATAQCGYTKLLTREDLENRGYRKVCPVCVKDSAEEANPEALSILAKLGWTDLIERAWVERYEASIQPKVFTWNGNGTTSYRISLKNGGKW